MVLSHPLTYHVCPNGPAGDWYWEVTFRGEIVARGLAPTQAQARADATEAAASYVPQPAEDPILLDDDLLQ